MTDAERLLAQVEAFRAERPRGGLLVGVGLIAATLALLLLAWMIARDRQHVAEIAQLRQVATAQQRTAQRQIADLQRTLAALRRDGDAATPLVRQAIAQADAAGRSLDGADASLDRIGQLTTAAGVAPPAEAPTQGVQTVTTDRSAGWDIDVFWCAGAGEGNNYAVARRAALLLGNAAAARTRVGPGTSLGRVRLRPVRVQDRGAWPPGYYVASDGGEGEDDAARQIAAFLTGRQPQAIGIATSRGAPTRWYLSVFACGS